MSTVEQRKLIGCLRAKLALDEDIYREMLSEFGCNSSKALTDAAAEIFIKKLKQNAIASGVWKPTKQYSFQKYKYNNETVVKGMATPAQRRKIEAMWLEVSRATNDSDRQSALKSFLKRLTGKDNYRFMTTKDVSIVIKALEQMKKQDKSLTH